MNLFKEIDGVKKDLPKFKTIEKEMGKYEFNGYQKFAIVTYLICLAFGVVLGNLFPACSNASLYSSVCTSTEFNFFLTVLFWFSSFLVCLFFFALGHIISLLGDIRDHISK
mgnify:FL=1